jgi:hypothetical protein
MSHKSSMHGGGESSDCIVPAKCANKGGEPSAERMEGRRSAKEIPEHWADTGHRARLRRHLQCVGSACGPRTGRACLSPRWEPCALGARARVCAGGGGQPSSLPRPAALPGGVAPRPHKLRRSRQSCTVSQYAGGARKSAYPDKWRHKGRISDKTATPPERGGGSPKGLTPRGNQMYKLK